MDTWYDESHDIGEPAYLSWSVDSPGNSPLSQRLLVLVGEEPGSQFPVTYALQWASCMGTEVEDARPGAVPWFSPPYTHRMIFAIRVTWRTAPGPGIVLDETVVARYPVP